MADELICLDTSILIEYFRKTKKEKSFFFEIAKRYSSFTVSIVTLFEVQVGSNDLQKPFWDKFFQNVTILPFDEKANEMAVEIFKDLKPKGQIIEMPDIFIGATAKANGLKLATLNEKHFARINDLNLLTKENLHPG